MSVIAPEPRAARWSGCRGNLRQHPATFAWTRSSGCSFEDRRIQSLPLGWNPWAEPATVAGQGYESFQATQRSERRLQGVDGR
jgi:hypothetical protein